MFASQYGWSKQHIDEYIYFDDVFFLVQKINKRRMEEYRMQLAIVQNPHVKEPKTLWDILDAYNREPVDEKLDKKSFELFKQKIASSPHIMVK